MVLPRLGVLVLGRGWALFRVVRLRGHKVRKVRGSAADAHDAADVVLYRDSSIAPLLGMRRRFKAVMDVLDSMIRHGVTFARSVELTVQWDKILSIGPLYPVTLDDFHAVGGFGLDDFHRVVGGVHHRLSDSIHGVVVHRRDEAIGGWRYWLREDPLGINGFGRIWCRLLHFFSVSLILHLVAPPSLLIHLGLMMKSETPGFLTCVALGEGRPALRNSLLKWMGGFLYYLLYLCLS